MGGSEVLQTSLEHSVNEVKYRSKLDIKSTIFAEETVQVRVFKAIFVLRKIY